MISIFASAERKTANILAYAVVGIGIFLVVSGAIVSGGLFLLGGAVIMPRFPFFPRVPSLVGWVIVALGFKALP